MARDFLFDVIFDHVQIQFLGIAAYNHPFALLLFLFLCFSEEHQIYCNIAPCFSWLFPSSLFVYYLFPWQSFPFSLFSLEIMVSFRTLKIRNYVGGLKNTNIS
jgi:hypothetical protein